MVLLSGSKPTNLVNLAIFFPLTSKLPNTALAAPTLSPSTGTVCALIAGLIPSNNLGSTSMTSAISSIAFLSIPYLPNCDTTPPSMPPKIADAPTLTADSPYVLVSWVECSAASVIALSAATIEPVTAALLNTFFPALYVLAYIPPIDNSDVRSSAPTGNPNTNDVAPPAAIVSLSFVSLASCLLTDSISSMLSAYIASFTNPAFAFSSSVKKEYASKSGSSFVSGNPYS